MSLILNIDTSTESAAVSIASDGALLYSLVNENQKDHAGFLHQAIKVVMEKASAALSSLSAIAVVHGPGSYTGLRVGMASAKGLCYALKKPLITIGTLDMMANAAIKSDENLNSTLFCPLIDARRMEVFTAIFNRQMQLVETANAMILNETSFEILLQNNKVCFFGSGAAKFKQLINAANASFFVVKSLIPSMAELSFTKYSTGNFTHLVNSEPLYIKEFHSSPDFTGEK